MGTNTLDIAAFVASNGVTRCEVGASGKGTAKRNPLGGAVKGKRNGRKGKSNLPAMAPIDTSVDGWQWEALTRPEILDSIKSGVFAALVGSGWQTDGETVIDRTSHIKVLLADSYLGKWDAYTGPNKNSLCGYVRMIAFQKTINYIKLHLHRHDGAVNAVKIDATDATAEDKAPRVVVDDSSALAYLRVDQRQRLTAAVDALDASERSHF